MSDAPSWWSSSLESECVDTADRGLPNEVVGLLCVSKQSVPSVGRSARSPTETDCADMADDMVTTQPTLHVFPALATPTSVEADPAAVVQFMYDVSRQERTILATLHSHPTGVSWFSFADQSLALMAHWHILLVHNRGVWRTVFGSSGR